MVIVDESSEGTNLKLKMGRNTLKTKGFKLNIVKIKYLKNNFSNAASKNKGGVRMDILKLVEAEVH